MNRKRKRSTCDIRPAVAQDANAIIGLNSNVVELTSPMDKKRFELLFSQCALIIVAERNGAIVGFLMGFDGNCQYDSANFKWFRSRLASFFYVDRVVVSETDRGTGIGKAFYQYIRNWSRDQRIETLAAEMNLEPANAASLAFHRSESFIQVGTRNPSEGKVLSMQTANCSTANEAQPTKAE